MPDKTNPIECAWRFVAEHMDVIERRARRWCGPHEREEFTQLVIEDVFDAHARGIYRPGASAPGTWIYTRARLVRTECDRREYRRRALLSTETGPPLRQQQDTGEWGHAGGERVGTDVPVPAGGWGCHEVMEQRAALGVVLAGASKQQRLVASTVLAGLTDREAADITGMTLAERAGCLRSLAPVPEA